MNINSMETRVQEPQIKEVKKMKDGSVSLPFSHETSMGIIEFNFKLEKKGDKIQISNLTKASERNQGYLKNKNQTFLLSTDSPQHFSKDLGKALDSYIGKDRLSLNHKKRQEAYKLLWFWDKLKQAEQKKIQEQTLRELKNLEQSLGDKVIRNKNKKTLTTEYNIGYGANEKVLYMSLKDLGNGKVQFSLESGFLFSLAQTHKIEKVFNKNWLKNQIHTFLSNELSNPLSYPRVIGKDIKYRMKEEVKNNMILKAKDSASLFLKYSE